MTPVDNSPYYFDYNLPLGGVQTFNLNVGTITSASCTDQVSAISYFISSLNPNVSALTQISVFQEAPPKLAVKSTAAADGPSVVTISASLPNGQSFPMQTINLGFCSILQTPPIFADVFATVGDANTTTIIEPTIPAEYASC